MTGFALTGAAPRLQLDAPILSEIRCPSCGRMQVKLKYGVIQARCRTCKILFMAIKVNHGDLPIITVSPA